MLEWSGFRFIDIKSLRGIDIKSLRYPHVLHEVDIVDEQLYTIVFSVSFIL